jgi:predicted glycosyltransferase
MSPEFMSAEEKASREELIKALSDILDSAGSLEELEKQEEKMKSAYGFYKLVTLHDPVWNYHKFRSRVSSDFVINRRRVSLGTSPSLTDVHVYMKDKLGINPQGV